MTNKDDPRVQRIVDGCNPVVTFSYCTAPAGEVLARQSEAHLDTTPPVATAEDLGSKFVAAIGQDPRPCARDVWNLLIEHPWHEAELLRLAQEVRLKWRPRPEAEEIVNEVNSLLYDCLERTGDLGFDPAKIKSGFGGWLGTILARCCHDAVVRLLDLHRHRKRLRSPVQPPDRWQPRDRQERLSYEDQHDLQQALAAKDEPTRLVLTEWSEGKTLKEITSMMVATKSTTYTYSAVRRMRDAGTKETRG